MELQSHKSGTGGFLFLAVIFLLCLGYGFWNDNMAVLLFPFGLLTLLLAWTNPRLLFFVLLFTLPISTELKVSGELSTDFPDELLMILSTGILIASFVFNQSSVERKYFNHPILIIFLLTILWTIVSISASDYLLISLKFIVAKTWYVGAFVLLPLMILLQKRHQLTAIRILCYTMFCIVFVILFRHATKSFSFIGINEAVVPFFRNHVNYSAMLVCMIPLSIILYRIEKRAWVKKFLLILIMIFLVALFFSYARGAWLALLAGIAAYFLIKRKLMVLTFIAVFITIVAGVFWLNHEKRYLQFAHDYNSTIYHENFRDHLQATYQGKDVSTAERFYRWIAGVRMVEEKPITGFGPGTFFNNYKEYTVPAYKTWVSRNPEQSTVHNYFLLVAIEQGIPGLIFLLLLIGVMFYYCEKLYHNSKDPFNRSTGLVCGIVLVMILTVNFLSDLIETDKIGSLYFLCMSMIIIADMREKKTNGSNTV